MLRPLVVGAISLALLATAGCGSDAGRESSPATSVPTTSAPARCTTSDPGGRGTGRRTLTHDGVERSYLLHLPGPAASPEPVPLIVGLHGYAGSSNGAAFAGFLACTEPYRFAAVAMVIATVPTTGCPAEHRPSVLAIRGTADAHVPFAGTPELVAQEAERAGCNPEPRTEHPAADVERTRYSGCRSGRAVVLDAVIGGTHRWPVPPPGSVTGSYDATDEILGFFGSRS